MDFDRLEQWMDTRVSNWAHCDGLANQAPRPAILMDLDALLRQHLRKYTQKLERRLP